LLLVTKVDIQEFVQIDRLDRLVLGLSYDWRFEHDK